MFYTYRQNNSGGSFIENESVGVWVIVEAHNMDMANKLAESYGLYFDGARDCPCCGNRWSEQWDDEDGHEQPQIYGKHYKEHVSKWLDETCVVHYLNGKKENLAFVKGGR
jgi:hypothetical protein